MRRNRAPIRQVAADPKYNHVGLAKFINRIMYDGKKSTAQSIVYGSLDVIAERTGKPAIEVFEQRNEKKRYKNSMKEKKKREYKRKRRK